MSDFESRHGEAVGIGVAIDTVYSSLALGLPRNDAKRVFRCLSDLGLPGVGGLQYISQFGRAF